ncbi:post-transcriptional regulator [Bacillus sp. 03113]|uniref:post-transcriptional regulator n=1 Tax=Bacillus sp. 03113 TaxID=2578211 RepID=UPI001143AD4B|nr:post-transcriptional regulator [Bacillus sp. 03113]
MEAGHKYDHFRKVVEPALQSKLEEFQLLGYNTITEDELWNYLTKKKWRKAKEEIKLFEIVQDIMMVKVSDYLNFATIESYKSDEFSLDNEKDRLELLK